MSLCGLSFAFLILSTFINPYSLFKSRNVLKTSQTNLIPALIKAKVFNDSGGSNIASKQILLSNDMLENNWKTFTQIMKKLGQNISLYF